MALPFMKAESEESATQSIAFVAIVAITLGLAVFNVTGAIVRSKPDTFLEYIITGALAAILAGAEILAAVALVRVMLAANRLRKVIGTAIFLGLAWACIQNGKYSAAEIFPEFDYSPALLDAKAEIASGQASTRDAAQNAAIAALPAELERVREQIADLRAEQRLMASQSPEKIAEAQQSLISQGKYFWAVDGVLGPETERAMRSRGEEIARELERLSLREGGLVSGQFAAPGQTTDRDSLAQDPAVVAAELEDDARRARQAAVWIEVMLWVMELARSFGLWALVTTVTAAKRAEDDESPSEDSEGSKPAPERDPRDGWTKKQWDSSKGADARDFKKRAANDAVVRIGSQLYSDRKEAAE